MSNPLDAIRIANQARAKREAEEAERLKFEQSEEDAKRDRLLNEAKRRAGEIHLAAGEMVDNFNEMSTDELEAALNKPVRLAVEGVMIDIKTDTGMTSTSDATVSELENRLREAEKTISAREKTISDLNKEIHVRETNLEKANQKIGSLEKEKLDISDERDQLKGEAAFLRETLDNRRGSFPTVKPKQPEPPASEPTTEEPAKKTEAKQPPKTLAGKAIEWVKPKAEKVTKISARPLPAVNTDPS